MQYTTLLSTASAEKDVETAYKQEFTRHWSNAQFSLLHPEYHLDSWDAGYYQLKYIWREHHKEQHDEFRKAFKKLEKSIIPGVYELGFLRTQGS